MAKTSSKRSSDFRARVEQLQERFLADSRVKSSALKQVAARSVSVQIARYEALAEAEAGGEPIPADVRRGMRSMPSEIRRGLAVLDLDDELGGDAGDDNDEGEPT
jgi:hypothetical protein